MKKIILFCFIMMGLVLSTLILAVGCEETTQNGDLEREAKCDAECQKFDWDFYKIDAIHTHPTTNYYCWCLDKDRKPVTLGKIGKEG